MTSFARYYENRKLCNFSMSKIEELLESENNRERIADIIYHRYYDRYLKLFFYSPSITHIYTLTEKGKEYEKILNEFNTEFKSGFVIMTNCCLLIETISTYFDGLNRSNKSGTETFKAVFLKAKEYNNSLAKFENQPLYSNIRCGLLHQGETYGKFKITRTGPLFDENNLTINAMRFCSQLKFFLNSYRNELKSAEWDSDIWNKCRLKLRYIIENSK
jgi:hypothetical protein